MLLKQIIIVIYPYGYPVYLVVKIYVMELYFHKVTICIIFFSS